MKIENRITLNHAQFTMLQKLLVTEEALKKYKDTQGAELARKLIEIVFMEPEPTEKFDVLAEELGLYIKEIFRGKPLFSSPWEEENTKETNN